jgi:hypothetical protein
MVLEWRERKHGEVDVAVERDPGDQMTLRICWIYKFWALKGMRAQVRLLQMLVNYLDPDTKAFNLDGKPLRIEVEEIYFMTGLSCRGEVVNLKSRGARSGMNIKDYISTHYVVGTKKVGSQLSIRAINNPNLKIIVLVLTWITRLASLHQESRTLMFYSMEFL